MNNHRYDNLRIDVVLQATGIHGWSASQGWINTLEREGLLNQVFRPIAAWGGEEPIHDDGLFEYLKNPQADIILMLGFDWHSQPLHKSIKWQERWHQAQTIKIALLQECYSAEVVQNTPAWEYQMHQAITNTIPCVDGLICHHEPDVDFLQKQLGISLPVIFLPFAIDTEYFKSHQKFSERLNRALFRGNAPRYFTENSYKQRQKLIEVLGQSKNIDIFSSNLNDSKQQFEILQEYVKELSSYKILLNLPSNSQTLTARPFEIMACGGLLLQNEVLGIESNALFQNWENIVYYDANNPEDLLTNIYYLISNAELTEDIAEKGHELCYQKHTLECRIHRILNWINNQLESKILDCHTVNRSRKIQLIKNSTDIDSGTLNQFSQPESSNFKIIVDAVFFQLYQTGIARVWKSLLEEWVNNGFAKHIVVLDRAGTAPKIPGIKYRNLLPYNYNDTVADREILQQVCDEEGASLFISSYYTTPTTTPSVFMAYDMIPEVMGWDMNNPMWREKHYGIEYASAHIAISQHTARDLVNCFPDISLESVTVAHCGVKSTFSPCQLEEINAFKSKYGITKPYFILVGVGSAYKNSILFFQALSQLSNSYGFDIVGTGSGGLLAPEFRAYTSGSIVHMLQLSDEELATAYSGAVALVYPSKYEGFGMPVIEAMACGCPVITCPNASIPEVAGKAAIYVDDSNVDELANALCDVQKPGIRNSLIAAGLAQAKKFSWLKMAETVSSALIDATLVSLNLKEINLIIFPDWSQPEELIGLELQRVMKAVATNTSSEKTTLLINTGNIPVEDAELFLSSVAMNLLVEEDLDVTEGLEISLVGNLADIQWEALLPNIYARIVLEHEDQQAIVQVQAENLPSRQLESLSNQLYVLQ
ncbi:glycosyltransferase family protein [Desmonostoc muscorum]|uniref:glycosyltransferase family protein n=1 Tax=Desmonostoc muscorum TaxID=1179 RepID=UPI002815D342|nr:glycosyltransferase [Desmonostoc muscorum]